MITIKRDFEIDLPETENCELNTSMISLEPIDEQPKNTIGIQIKKGCLTYSVINPSKSYQYTNKLPYLFYFYSLYSGLRLYNDFGTYNIFYYSITTFIIFILSTRYKLCVYNTHKITDKNKALSITENELFNTMINEEM